MIRAVSTFARAAWALQSSASARHTAERRSRYADQARSLRPHFNGTGSTSQSSARTSKTSARTASPPAVSKLPDADVKPMFGSLASQSWKLLTK